MGGRWKPELSLLMDWLLFRFTVLRNQPTPGMRMQGLRYADGGSGKDPCLLLGGGQGSGGVRGW